jgi:hypothetical protein
MTATTSPHYKNAPRQGEVFFVVECGDSITPYLFCQEYYAISNQMCEKIPQSGQSTDWGMG